MQAESFVGVPVLDSAHRVTGHLVVIDDKPMEGDPFWISVLQTFARRVGAELERERADLQLREALAEVERLRNQLQAENVPAGKKFAANTISRRWSARAPRCWHCSGESNEWR